MDEEQGTSGDIADLSGAGGDVLQGRPAAGEQGESAPDFLKSKADIMKYLRGSFAYLHRAAAAVSENNETETIEAFDGRTLPGLVVDALCHSWNHYGQMIEYLRINAIVPPASRP